MFIIIFIWYYSYLSLADDALKRETLKNRKILLFLCFLVNIKWKLARNSPFEYSLSLSHYIMLRKPVLYLTAWLFSNPFAVHQHASVIDNAS